MLPDMDNLEASCVFYVKIGMFNQLEQSKICLLTINKMEIVRLIIQYEFSVCISLMYYPSDFLRQTSAAIISLEDCTIDIWQL